MFTAPTLSEMRAVVWRSLRDTNGAVFPSQTIDDFIVQGMSDLSAYRPKEASVVSVWPLPDPSPFVGFTAVWMVQARVAYSASYTRVTTIPPAGHGSGEARAGWEFYDGQVLLPPFYLTKFEAYADQGWPTEIVVYGYGDRDLPEVDGDVLDLDGSTDYLCLLNHCKHLGFELLDHDRALYQQWLAATNNTDVSPTQLQGMTTAAEQTFERTRARNSRLRRMPAGDIAYSI